MSSATPEALEFSPAQKLIVWYVNWRGVREVRHIDAQQLWFGSTKWHPTPQWLLTGRDLDKDELRDFAVKDMEPVQEAARLPFPPTRPPRP
jgi:hypothetical protein